MKRPPLGAIKRVGLWVIFSLLLVAVTLCGVCLVEKVLTG